MRVLAAHAAAAPLAELRLVIPYARTEPGLTAAQELLAACLGTGSRDRTRQDIADRAADLGAEFSTVVTAESLILSVSVLAPGLPGALDLLAELLLRPRYEEGEVALGEEPDAVLRLVGERLAPWSGGPSGLRLPSFARPVPRPGTVELTEPGAPGAGRGDAVGEQSLVLTVGPGVPTAEPLHAPFHLAQLLLGGYASARLARRVRDRYGLAYDVSAGLRENGAGSWLEIACAGAPGGAGRIAAEIT
ncbi:insulinase family protein, partial [Streptomyces sp. MBT56]|nr:insulinase family protein [Streptomyces sp. MBT56]